MLLKGEHVDDQKRNQGSWRRLPERCFLTLLTPLDKVLDFGDHPRLVELVADLLENVLLQAGVLYSVHLEHGTIRRSSGLPQLAIPQYHLQGWDTADIPRGACDVQFFHRVDVLGDKRQPDQGDGAPEGSAGVRHPVSFGGLGRGLSEIHLVVRKRLAHSHVSGGQGGFEGSYEALGDWQALSTAIPCQKLTKLIFHFKNACNHL